ncbi:hypothetical protein [Sulfuracidifex metallicus]|nr:hypothetical protein [Sulfuracidifex metallicus]
MTGLRRDLSRWELTYLSLGGIIGSGWLFAPLAAAAYAGPRLFSRGFWAV